jgi:hypothetical protein
MKNKYWIFFLLLNIQLQAQQLQWEKVIQKGWGHKVQLAYPLSDDHIYIQSKVHQSRTIVLENELLILNWDGSIQEMKQTNSEHWSVLPSINGNDVTLIGTGAGGYNCSWCATGMYGQWEYYFVGLPSPEVNTYISTDSYLTELGIWYMNNYPKPCGSFRTSSGSLITAGQSRVERVWDFPVYPKVEFDSLNIPVIGLFPYQTNIGLAFTNSAIYTLDTNAVMGLVAQFPFSIDSVSNISNTSDYLVYSHDTIRHINTSGTVLETLALNPLMDSVFQVQNKNNVFWILGELNGNVVLNSYVSGALQSSFVPDTTKADFRNFVLDINSDRLLLIGYETAVNNKHLILQMYDNQLPAITKSDYSIGISTFDIISGLFVQCHPFIPNYPKAMYSVNVEVMNHSVLPVDSFYINGKWNATFIDEFYCSRICYDSQLVQKVIMHIDPGANVQVKVDFDAGVNPLLPVCFWTSAPNGQPDRDPSDDQMCFDIPLGLNELLIDQEIINVYPNPSVDETHFYFPQHWTSSTITFRISDVTGRTIETNDFSGTELTYSTANLPNGLYWVSFITDDGKMANVPLMVIK